MTEKKASLPETIRFAKEAVVFVTRKTSSAREFNGEYPLIGLEKFFFILDKLRPKELKQVLLIYSSHNYGQFILDSVFPKFDNPEPFHSTEFVVDLSDQVVQVLGWQEQKQMVNDGVKEGLIRGWIDAGFEDRATERGIDLEWHFFEFPRQPKAQESNLLE